MIVLPSLSLHMLHPPPGMPTPFTLSFLGKAAWAVIQTESSSMLSLHSRGDIGLHRSMYSILPLSLRPPLNCRYLKNTEHVV